MRARVLLVRIAEARRLLERDVLQPGTPQGAAGGLDGRWAIAVSLVAAQAAQVIQEPLTTGEGGGVLLTSRDGPIGSDRLLRVGIDLEPRQGLAGETALAIVGDCQGDVGRDALTDSGMTFGATFLAHEPGGGLLQSAHAETARDG